MYTVLGMIDWLEFFRPPTFNMDPGPKLALLRPQHHGKQKNSNFKNSLTFLLISSFVLLPVQTFFAIPEEVDWI